MFYLLSWKVNISRNDQSIRSVLCCCYTAWLSQGKSLYEALQIFILFTVSEILNAVIFLKHHSVSPSNSYSLRWYPIYWPLYLLVHYAYFLRYSSSFLVLYTRSTFHSAKVVLFSLFLIFCHYTRPTSKCCSRVSGRVLSNVLCYEPRIWLTSELFLVAISQHRLLKTGKWSEDKES